MITDGPRRLWPFAVWLAAFYAVWAAVVFGRGLWPLAVEHWPIAAAMAAGSYFAGSTPMGGGTVGFPVLVLLFGSPASLGRDFGLAVQSVGMVSASIYILAARRPVDRALLVPALLGAALATPVGVAFVAPHAPDLFVKLLFAVVWGSFGVIHWLKIGAIVQPDGLRMPHARLDRPIGLAIGVLGGLVASVTGVGVDMMIYSVLVLYYRSDLKVAIPTSVILMAFVSVVGAASALALARLGSPDHAIAPALFANWLAAAPVVAIGAPFGAIVVNRLPRKPTLLIVSTLCIGQFVWTLVSERPGAVVLAAAIVALAATCALFLKLFELGHPHAEARELSSRDPARVP